MTPLQHFCTDYENKKVLIFGLGILGRGVGDAAFFKEIGSDVRVTDLKTESELASSLETLSSYNLTYTLGCHSKTDIEWADVIIRNASVPYRHELLEYARSLGKPVVMEDALFVKYAGITTIGITGTRGKTTTTTMIYEILTKYSGKKVLLGGNIAGVATLPLLKQVVDQESTLAVLELSSWQLQGFHDLELSPTIAVITNIYPDHLNTYASMEEYIKDKTHIFHHQKPEDHLCLNAGQETICAPWVNEVKSTLHWFRASDIAEEVTLSLRGDHNRENAAAALAVATIMGIDKKDSLESLKTQKPVAFRLEEVGERSGIHFINDTTSTTPTATIKALESFAEPITLILGGNDKKLPIDALVKCLQEKTPKLVLLAGNGTERIKNSLDPETIIGEYTTMVDAVRAAYQNTPSPGTVVLSPGFTSFGLFRNEFDRGEQFNTAVFALV